VVPAIVSQAATVAAGDHAGIIEYRVRQIGQVDGGPFHQHDDISIAVVTDGDKVVRVRVLSYVQDGAQQSDAAKAQVQSQLENGTERFANPFDVRSFADYSFSVDGSTVHFVSLKRDADHGDGWFQVDATGHVTKMTYTPDVMPKYVSSATVTLQRGAVLPGFWATTSSVTSFKGHYLFIHGGATFTTLQSTFRRFNDRKAALADLASLQE